MYHGLSVQAGVFHGTGHTYYKVPVLQDGLVNGSSHSPADRYGMWHNCYSLHSYACCDRSDHKQYQCDNLHIRYMVPESDHVPVQYGKPNNPAGLYGKQYSPDLPGLCEHHGSPVPAVESYDTGHMH